MDINRRKFLAQLSAATIVRCPVRAAGGAAAVFFGGARPAHAWVMAAIAVASTVASMVAAHNRGDGGLGATLGATQQKLGLILDNLNNIQKNVADVLEDLRKLPSEFEATLQRDDVRKLQRECRSIISEYIKIIQANQILANNADRYNEEVRVDLRSLLYRLQSARGNLRADGAIDPATALVASSVAFLEHSLMQALQYPQEYIVANLSAEYGSWFRDIADARLSRSAQSYANTAYARHNQLLKLASETNFGKRYGLTFDKNHLNVCVGVDDFVPEVKGKMVCDPDPRFLNNEGGMVFYASTSGGDPHNGSTNQDQHQAQRLGRCNLVGARAEVKGPSDRLYQDVILKQDELVVNGINTGILNIQAIAQPEKRTPAGTPATPPDNLCNVQKVSILDESKRLAFMKNSQAWRQAQTDIDNLNRLFEDIQTERARISFGVASVGIANIAQKQLNDLLERYR